MSGETEIQPTGWTIDTLAVHIRSLIARVETELQTAVDTAAVRDGETDRRYLALLEAIGQRVDVELRSVRTEITNQDRRDSERWDQQSVATNAAYVAQQKAMDAAFAAAKEAVAAALQSAKEAVDKAEIASSKRFESVNEFRAQLADQAATLMPRAEAGVLLQAMGDRVDALSRQFDERMGVLNEQHRLLALDARGLITRRDVEDLVKGADARANSLAEKVVFKSGADAGSQSNRDNRRSDIAILISVITTIVMVISVVVVVLTR